MRLLTTWCKKVKLEISARNAPYTLMKEKLQRAPLIRVEAQTITRQTMVRYQGKIRKTELPRPYRKCLYQNRIAKAVQYYIYEGTLRRHWNHATIFGSDHKSGHVDEEEQTEKSRRSNEH